MAFKNLLYPNSAECSRFTNDLGGIYKSWHAGVNIEIVEDEGIQVIHVTTENGGGLALAHLPIPALYTFSALVKSTGTIYIYCGGYVQPEIYHLNGEYEVISATRDIPAPPNSDGAQYIFNSTPDSEFYVRWMQVEQNDHFTGYEFPGLTPEPVPTRSNTEPLRLNSLLKPLKILSGEVFGLTSVLSMLKPEPVRSDGRNTDLILESLLKLDEIESSIEIGDIKIIEMLIRYYESVILSEKEYQIEAESEKEYQIELEKEKRYD